MGARLRLLDPERLDKLSPADTEPLDGPRSETLRVKFPSARWPMLSFDDADDNLDWR